MPLNDYNVSEADLHQWATGSNWLKLWQSIQKAEEGSPAVINQSWLLPTGDIVRTSICDGKVQSAHLEM